MERRHVIYFSNPVWENAAYLHPYDASFIGYKDMNTGNLVWTDPSGTRAPIPGGTQVSNALRVSPDDPESLQRARILDIARKNETHARRADRSMQSTKMGLGVTGVGLGLYHGLYPTLGHLYPGTFAEKMTSPAAKIATSKLLGWKWSDPDFNVAGDTANAMADAGSNLISQATDAFTTAASDPSVLGAVATGTAAAAKLAGATLATASPFILPALSLIPPALLLRRWMKTRKQKKKALEQAKKAREMLGMKSELGDNAYKYYQNEGLYADNPLQYLNYRPDRGFRQLKFA